MEYYTVLGLKREPFSNSPDPGFFFRSSNQGECLNRLEIAIRLKRGLNVVLGEVGTGKTTLCRLLIRSLDGDDMIRTHLVLDPCFESGEEFLRVLCGMFTGEGSDADASRREVMERLKKEVYRQALELGRTLVLIVDEGQKTSPECLEVLRELLNYETNTEKLLQIVIFGQNELSPIIEGLPNFRDRINEYLTLGALTAPETRDMIHYRLAVAGGAKAKKLFPSRACRMAYRMTGGHPRRIMHLCHQVLMALIIRNERVASAALVKGCSNRSLPRKTGWAWLAPVAALAAAVLVAWHFKGPEIRDMAQSFVNRTPVAVTDVPAVPEEAEAPVVPEAAPSPAAVAPVFEPEVVPEPEAVAEKPAGSFGDGITAAGMPSGDAVYGADGRPLILGSLTVEGEQFVSRMIDRIYGVYRNAYLEEVKLANPQVRSFKRAPQGTQVFFPAMSFEADPVYSRGYLLKIDEFGTLREAYDFLCAYHDLNKYLRLVPCWDEENDLRFVVLGPGVYEDLHSAKKAQQKYVDASGIPMTIAEAFPEGTVFYHNFDIPPALDWRRKALEGDA